jgi:hypothetical protein
LEPFDMVDVSHLFVEGSIPIKEYCFVSHTSPDCGMPN